MTIPTDINYIPNGPVSVPLAGAVALTPETRKPEGFGAHGEIDVQARFFAEERALSTVWEA